MKKIAIIMGSDSDLPVVEKAAQTLSEYGVPFEMRIMSAHRTPDVVREFIGSARENGFGAVIAAAGKAAPRLFRLLRRPAQQRNAQCRRRIYQRRIPHCIRAHRQKGIRKAHSKPQHPFFHR